MAQRIRRKVPLHMRSFVDVQLICRKLDPYLGELKLHQINGDVI